MKAAKHLSPFAAFIERNVCLAVELSSKSPRFVTPFYNSLWLLALIIYVLSGTTITPFHGDEATLIFMSRDYAYQVLQGDLSKIYYSATPTSPTEQELRLLNGTVSKFLYGLAWHMRGFTLEDINEQWDWGVDWQYNQQYGHAPSDALLQTARLLSALQTAAGVLVMFAIGWLVYGQPAAYLSSLYYALSPVILLNGRRAMMDGSLLLFSLLAVWAALWYLRRCDMRRAVVLGVVSGLALASKHTALFTIVGVFGACILYPLVARVALWRCWRGVILAGSLALVVFYVLNPAWWGTNLFTVGQEVLRLRQNTLDTQIRFLGGYANSGEKAAGFVRQTLPGLPQYYEVSNWADFIADQIAEYETSLWRGVSVGGGLLGSMIFAGTILLGGTALLRERSITLVDRLVIGLWALSVILGTLLLTPLEWQRYYLPALPAIGLLAALGIAWCIRYGRTTYAK